MKKILQALNKKTKLGKSETGEGAAWHRGSVRASQPSIAGLTQPKTKIEFLFIGMLFIESLYLLTAPKFLGSNSSKILFCVRRIGAKKYFARR